LQKRQKLPAITIMALLLFWTILFAIPATEAATPTITLTPNPQASGAPVTVDGTDFGATKNVSIGFGAEVAVTGEVISSTGSGTGPYTGIVANRPVKPGTARFTHVVGGGLVTFVVTDLGNGTLTSTSEFFANGTINYATGEYIRYSTTDPGTLTVVVTADYTHYQSSVTPAAGITTSSSGAFSASITVPSVPNGNYNVTAIDASGNRAVSSLSVEASPSGWSKTYGGAGDDKGTGELVQTSDGGYAILGDTSSFGAGGTDFWLIKTDASGTMQWNRTYGGASDELSGEMCQTSDGGYALAGATTSFGAGGRDFYLVKTDANGVMLWNRTYGGTDNEYAYSVIQSADGGYVMAGVTRSFGAGGMDFYFIKTDAAGTMLWSKTYGGAGDEVALRVVQTSDGGYALSGHTNSSGAGGYDFWLVKTDAAGNMQWNKTCGGTGNDQNAYVVQTSDEGYAIIGYSTSFGGYKAYLAKTDASGTMQWNKTYESGTVTIGMHVIQTADGGFVIVGWNYLNGQDFLLIKTDSAGNMQWNQTYGGTGIENAYSVIQTTDGGYALAGFTTSFGAGGYDFWLVKVDEFGVVPEGLTIGVMLILSTFAVIVSIRYFRKRLGFEDCGLGKP
jgi:predicted secreted protein